MADKKALHELQSRLADRMQAALTQAPGLSWLAVECGGHGFLFPLPDAGEIFPMTTIATVAHAQPWFLGVANLRGGMHGVVDLAGFLGIKVPETTRERARLVAFNPKLETNSALLVGRLAGLRSAAQLIPQIGAAQHRPAFVGERFRDEAGRAWQELNLSALARDETFLKVAA